MINRILAKYRWLYFRFKVMSFKEVLYRIKVTYLEKTYKVDPKKNLLHFDYQKSSFQNYFLFIENEDINDNLNINCKENTKINIFNTKIELDNVVWNKDYVNDYIFENKHFSKLQFHNFANKELKPVLELNRFQFLIGIAYCYRATKNEKYLKQVISLLESWIDANQIPYGLIWKSGFGTAIRLISWIIVWQLIDFNAIKNKYQDFSHKWQNSINDQLTILTVFLSKYSSAGNHLIGEYLGIYISLIFFRDQLVNKNKLDFYKTKLENEILRQNFLDGVNKESAYGYLNQAHEWIFLYLYSSKRLGLQVNMKIEELFYKMTEFIYFSLDEHDNFFDYGDRDDGAIIKVFAEKDYISPMENCNLASFYFKDTKFLKPTYINEKHKLFFPTLKLDKVEKPNKDNGIKIFNESGHAIIKKSINNKYNIHLHVKFGPFGSFKLAGHSHSDLNSFFLSINGIAVFVDSGTYCYRENKNFRSYFQGSAAHNTIRVNKHNQAIKYGPNHWVHDKKIYSRLTTMSESDTKIVLDLLLTTKEYTHKRTFEIDKNNCSILIIDEVNSNIKHNDYEKFFILHPQIEIVKKEFGILKIKNQDLELNMEFTENDEPTNSIYIKNSFINTIKTKTRIYI